MQPDILERYEQMLALKGTPLARLAFLFKFLVNEGICPSGEKVWTSRELGRLFGVDPKMIGNYMNGRNKVPKEAPEVFFKTDEEETEQRRQMRRELRRRLDAAWNKGPPLGPLRKPHQSDVETKLPPTEAVKRSPTLYWDPADADKRINECLDQEPEAVDLFLSVFDFAHESSLIARRFMSRPRDVVKIRRINIIRLHPELVERLVRTRSLNYEFEKALNARLHSFAKHIASTYQLVVLERWWKRVPDFHGYLFGNSRFTNQWAYAKGKLHTDTPLLEYPAPDWDEEIRAAKQEANACPIARVFNIDMEMVSALPEDVEARQMPPEWLD